VCRRSRYVIGTIWEEVAMPKSAVVPLLVIAVGFLVNYALQRNRSTLYNYRCENCGQIFSLSPLTGAVSPHRIGGRKWIRCPGCRSFSWATPIPKSET
jgi:DNA-directed RNA polymerase subunit RPC12/RpoP